MQVYGNTYKSNTKSVYILHKRANRLVNKADYLAPAGKLFSKLMALKLKICFM